MVTLEEVLVTSMRLLGGAEGAVGREGKGVSHLQGGTRMCKRGSGMRGAQGYASSRAQSMDALSVAVFLHELSTTVDY